MSEQFKMVSFSRGEGRTADLSLFTEEQAAKVQQFH